MPCRWGRSDRIHSRMAELKCFVDGGAGRSLDMSVLSFVGGASEGKEASGDRGELLVELEDAAMARVGVDDQLGVRDPRVQIL